MTERSRTTNSRTRTTSRGQTPPVNLKERIAALQQRSVSPNLHQSAQAASRGLPNAGIGRLRDKIAKFEEKGGVPVPRGSFAMGAPQLAENASPKRCGELYGNRVLGLGRPSGAPVSQSESPQPSTDESPGPRKRCISSGATLSNGLPNSSTDEPVPALPSGLSSSAPRRNSLAVNFGSGRRVVSTSDAEDNEVGFVDALSPSLSPLVPEEPSEINDSPTPSPEPVVDVTPLEVEEPQPLALQASEVALQPLESPPDVEQPSPVDSVDSKVDAPVKDTPASQDQPLPVPDAFQNASQPPTCQPASKDHESTPQLAISQPSSSLFEPTSSVPPSEPTTPSATATPTPAPAETVVVSPPEEATKQVDAPQGDAVPTPEPDLTVAAPPSTPMSSLSTETRSQSKPNFKAVVHRKTAGPPVDPVVSSLAPPPTSHQTQRRRGANNNVVQMSPSPGYGDLSVLLEDAALLEMRLTEGDSTGLNRKELLATTPTNATFHPDSRHVSASTLTEYVPVSSDSGSQSVRSVSIPSIREPSVDGETPDGDETDGRSLASTTFSQRSVSHRKYLSNISRLTGRRSSSYMPGSYPRDSMSMSSEDSSSVTTPSDNGKRKGFGIHWPSSSPRKDEPNVGRSTSFADKIFNRNRTKSNVSTADQASERGSLYESSHPTLSLSFPSKLSHETHPDGVGIDAPPKPWVSSADSNSEFSPTSSPLDKDIFDAFPSVPQTLPPGYHLDAENAGVGRASNLPINLRLSMA